MKMRTWTGILFSLFALTANAETLTVNIALVDSFHRSIGYVTLSDTAYGMLITPRLRGLSPGVHGFHVHMIPSCNDHGMAAGEHLDPFHTQKHLGPYNPRGHLGDLPALTVNPDGTATLPLLAPRLKVGTVRNHALMIHGGGDNYSDTPPMGGGGQRIACGVIG